MAERVKVDPKQQFSKKLARWTAVFWFAYMTWLSVILVLEPKAASWSFYMSIVVSVVMLINIYSYCKNSLTEKVLLTLLDKTRLEIGAKRKGGDTDEEMTEEGDNG